MTNTVVPKKKRVRSPAYPALDLETAIEKARAINDHKMRDAMPVADVARYWGTDIKNSSGLRGISTLKQFGFIIEEGRGVDRKIRLMDRAFDSFTQSSPKYRQAIRDAALSPKIHRRLWSHYEGNLPPNESLKDYLVDQLGFNSTHVYAFINQFRKTIAFAKLDDYDANTAATEELSKESREQGTQIASQNQSPMTKKEPNSPCIVFPLAGDNVLEIRLRKKVSPKDFERIRQLVDLSEHSLVDYDEESKVAQPERVAR